MSSNTAAKLDRLFYLYQTLSHTISSFPEEKRQLKLFDKWSPQDVVAHINNWILHDINCLEDMRMGIEPYWEPNVDSFNQMGVLKRKDLSWNVLQQEFITLGQRLIDIYTELPGDMWNILIWPDKDETPKTFLLEDIQHWELHLIDLQTAPTSM